MMTPKKRTATLPPVLLTEDSVRAATLPPGQRQVVLRDTELKGFMLVISAGAKTYAIQRHLRVDRGIKHTVRMTVTRKDGSRPESVKEARRLAKALLLEIEKGNDPRQHRPNDPTLKDAWDHYVEDLRLRKRSDEGITQTAAMLDNHFGDWRTTPLRSLGRQTDVLLKRFRKLNQKGTEGHAGAKPMRTFRTVYDVYRRAHARLDLPPNPLEGQRFGDYDSEVQDFLEPAQMQEWMRRVDTVNDPVLRTFHLVCFFSGIRPGALCGARAENLDLDKGVLLFTRMKNRSEFEMPLSGRLREVLLSRSNAHEWLFPWTTKSGHLEEYDSPELKMAGHEGEVHCWTGHWLRRNFASHAEAVISRDEVSALLHHRRGGVTGRYSHQAARLGMMLRLQETVTAHLLSLLGP